MSGTAITIIVVAVILVIWLLGQSIRTVRPTSRGLIERFGKYNRFANPGIIFLIPFIEHLVRVNITENMIDAGLQEIITSDSLNAQVDAQVYLCVQIFRIYLKCFKELFCCFSCSPLRFQSKAKVVVGQVII